MAKKKRFNYDGLVVKKGDSIDDARDKNDKLIKKLKKAERETSQLRTQVKTIQEAWSKTEVFLSDFMGDMDLFDLINQSNDGKLLKVELEDKKSGKCTKCKTNETKTLVFDGFVIHICKSCNHREKIEDSKSKARKKNKQKSK